MTKNATLLVVDDEEIVLNMTEHALKDGGYAVVRAQSGDEAIALLESKRDFAGLITDVNLGAEMDGWRVAQRARELKPNIPIVYTTGFASRDWTARGVPNSIVVQKPFSVDEIVAAIWSLLNGVEV